MYCRFCGKQIPDQAKFCPECGADLAPAPSAAPPESTPSFPAAPAAPVEPAMPPQGTPDPAAAAAYQKHLAVYKALYPNMKGAYEALADYQASLNEQNQPAQ